MTDDYENKRAVLIAVDCPIEGECWTIDESLEELKDLVETVGIFVCDVVTQKRYLPHPKFYLGTGKLNELKEYSDENNISVIVSDMELTPSQYKHMESVLKIKILDRTSLILDIFAKRAQTYEAKLQVELAQLIYMLPRLTRMWTHLSRTAGGIGSKGPGEKQLEVDKRLIRKRMDILKERLLKVKNRRKIQRKSRAEKPVYSGVLVGYTNAGKSTLLNALTASDVLAEDKLFATLDPTSRRLSLDNQEIVLTDTVGFIQKLPHHLVEAFHSTLEVVTDADFILHVIDASHQNKLGMIETSKAILNDLNIGDIPIIYVFNKWDCVTKPNMVKRELKAIEPFVCISAKNGDLLSLLEAISSLRPQLMVSTFYIPYNRMDLVHLFHEKGNVLSLDYRDKDILIEVSIDEKNKQQIINQLA